MSEKRAFVYYTFLMIIQISQKTLIWSKIEKSIKKLLPINVASFLLSDFDVNQTWNRSNKTSQNLKSCHHKFTLRCCEKSDKSFEVDKRNLNTEFLRRIGQVMSRKIVSVDNSKQNIWKTVKKTTKHIYFWTLVQKKKKNLEGRRDTSLWPELVWIFSLYFIIS